MVNTCTAILNIIISSFYEKKSIVLYHPENKYQFVLVKLLVFVIWMVCVLYEVRTELLYDFKCSVG